MDKEEFTQSLNHDSLNKTYTRSSATDQNFSSLNIIGKKNIKKKNSQREIFQSIRL